MSVFVRIEYRQPDPDHGGKEKAIVFREMEIRRVIADGNNPKWPERDDVFDYEVFGVRRRFRSPRRATFKHRYGDDLAVLIGKAGEALRLMYGNF